MNHNSFPSGEQSPSQSEGGDIAEYPSFEEHMREMRQYATEINARTLTRPSLKNEEISETSVRLMPEVEEISQKVKKGEKLDIKDISSLSEVYDFDLDGAEEFLEEVGLSDGKSFDVKVPGIIISPDGNRERTPLDISFENNEGDFTRISIEKGKDDNKTHIYSWKGRREFTDVGYNGPVPIKTTDGNETRDQKAMTIE